MCKWFLNARQFLSLIRKQRSILTYRTEGVSEMSLNKPFHIFKKRAILRPPSHCTCNVQGRRTKPIDGIVLMYIRDKACEGTCRHNRTAGLKLLATVRMRTCKPRDRHISFTSQRAVTGNCEASPMPRKRVYLSVDLQ